MNAVQCDYCGKFAPNPKAFMRGDPYRNSRLPDDWHSVESARGGMSNPDKDAFDGGEFCSRECISGHFAKPAA